MATRQANRSYLCNLSFFLDIPFAHSRRAGNNRPLADVTDKRSQVKIVAFHDDLLMKL